MQFWPYYILQKKSYQDTEFRGNIVSYDNANVQKVKL